MELEAAMIQSKLAVGHIAPLYPLDVGSRLDELAELPPGWLDGKGLALDKSGLQTLARDFDNWFDPALPLPYLYPTAEGGIQAEWSMNQWEISLKIDLNQYRAQYQALFLSEQRTEETGFDLAGQAEWDRLNQTLSAILALPTSGSKHCHCDIYTAVLSKRDAPR